MARKYNFIFYLAILVAIGATYGVYRVIESARVANQVATRSVVVASRNLPHGALVDDALRVEQWPEPIVPDSAFADPALLTGRVSRVPIYAGEVFVPGRLAPEGTGQGLEAKIAPGKRAVSMRVDDISGIGGLIQPDSRVDLLLNLDANSNGGGTQRTAKMFMPNMRVLAMGSDVQRNEKGEAIRTTVATLEATPQESERLNVALSMGRMVLVLRGFADADSVRTRGATASDVIASLRDVTPQPAGERSSRPATRPAPTVVEAPPVSAPVPAPASTIQRSDTARIPVYRGAKRTDEKVSRDSARRDTIKP